MPVGQEACRDSGRVCLPLVPSETSSWNSLLHLVALCLVNSHMHFLFEAGGEQKLFDL